MKMNSKFTAILVENIKKEKAGLLFSIVVIILRSIILLTPPLVTQILIDEILGRTELNYLWEYCLVLFLIPVASASSIYMEKFFLKGLIRASSDSRVELMKSLIYQEYKKQKEYDNGANAFLVCDKVNELASKMFDGVGSFIWCLFTVLTGVIFCMMQNIPLTIYLLTITILDEKVVKFFSKISETLNRKYLNNSTKKAVFFRDTEAAIKEIRMQGTENRFTRKYEELLSDELQYMKRQQRVENLITFIGEMADALVYIGIYVGGVLLVELNMCTVGKMVALAGLYDSIFMPIHMLNGMFLNLVSIKNVVTKLDDILLDYVEREKQGADHLNSLEMKDVCFQYEQKKVLENAEICIEKNFLTFLIGKSGSGKSTTCDLIMGLLQPSSGVILINGNIDDIEKYRKKVQYVSQKAVIINGTIMENLLYGLDHDISEDELNEAIDISQLKKWVESLSDGLDTMCENEGFTLSGGEKQRICLARALLGRPDMLILDESISAVDAETSLEILKGIKQKKNKMGILFITHNMNLSRMADVIYDLQEGKIRRVEKNEFIR